LEWNSNSQEGVQKLRATIIIKGVLACSRFVARIAMQNEYRAPPLSFILTTEESTYSLQGLLRTKSSVN
jgi:hypothetical protein